MIVIAYVPVLHEGYRRFFEKYKDAELWLLGDDVKEKFVPLVKDIRALPVEYIKKSIETWGIFSNVKIIGIEILKKLPKNKIVMPDEDIMHELHAEYFPKIKNIKFDSVFLRWDKHKSMDKIPVEVDQKVSKEKFDIEVMRELRKEATKSADFWRGVASAVIKDKKIIFLKHNDHVPNKIQPYVDGDPRSDFHKGVNMEVTTALHSEAGIVAEAAKKGISLEGLSMYVSTFPCPACAKMIAYSGIKKIYYSDGYGSLDGERVLKSQGVEIIFVDEGKREKIKRGAQMVEYKRK